MARRIRWAGLVPVMVAILMIRNLAWLKTSQFEDSVDDISTPASAGSNFSSSTSPNTARSSWATAVYKSTEILYRDSSPTVRKFWLSQPPPTIYIYDNIPAEFSDVATMSSCVDRNFLGQNFTEVWVENKQNCLWRPEICEDFNRPSKPKEKKFFSYRQNYNMDVAYLDKFHRYPYQTTDPSKADIFVVPYPHKSHCLCHQDFKKHSAECAAPFHDMKENVLERLILMKNTTLKSAKRRHLFFHGADWLQQNRMFRATTSDSMSLSLGPVWPCGPEGPCGHVALPYISTDLDYQPFMSRDPSEDALRSRLSDREFFLGAALGSSRGLQLRSQFLKEWELWIGNSIGGKTNHVLNIGNKRTGKISRVYKDLYRNSTVCLVLPGDGCAQKRFFDAVLNGCIPLVPVYPSNEDAWPISFHYQQCSTRITYPFAKGTFYQEPSAGIEILDLVATYNGTCGFPCMKIALKELASDLGVLQAKYNKLREYGSLVKFGLDDRSNSFPDAFSALLVRLRHHTWVLQGKLRGIGAY